MMLDIGLQYDLIEYLSNSIKEARNLKNRQLVESALNLESRILFTKQTSLISLDSVSDSSLCIINYLPVEILQNILSRLPNLNNAALVNKHWSSISHSLLYRHISLENDREYLHFIMGRRFHSDYIKKSLKWSPIPRPISFSIDVDWEHYYDGVSKLVDNLESFCDLSRLKHLSLNLNIWYLNLIQVSISY